MKKIIVSSLVFCLFFLTIYAQPVLYGTNQIGNGNIVEFDVATRSPKIVYSFPNDGLAPATLKELTSAGNGIYYGTTPRGGKWGGGVLFKFDSLARTYTVLYDFNASVGEYPYGKLVLLPDGKLYGIANGFNLTEYHYKQTPGVIFSFDPQLGKLMILHSFEYRINPIGNLVQGVNGNLYGIASNGIYSYDVVGGIYELVYNGAFYTGYQFDGGLTLANNGKLYGLEYYAVGAQFGAVFSFDPTTKTFSLENAFTEQNSDPHGTLSREYNGVMYGSTGATIFSFDLNSKEIVTLHSSSHEDYAFKNTSYDIVVGKNGKLYGIDHGGFFSYDPLNSEFQYLQESANDLSRMPQQTFIVNDTGLIAVNPGSSAYELIKKLDAPVGLAPQEELVQSTRGNFYGVTTAGGKYGFGGIFSYNPFTHSAEMLIDYNDYTMRPFCRLTEGPDLNLYYTTQFGPNVYETDGRLIRLNIAERKLEVLHVFPQYIEGLVTNGPLEKGRDGKLYGITDYSTGSSSKIFRFDPGQNLFEILGDVTISFSIRFGMDGKLYGVSEPDEQSRNQIFSYDLDSKIEKKTPITIGAYVKHRLAQDSAGAFYTSAELPDVKVFKFDPITEIVSPVVTLNYLTALDISAPLMLSPANTLYGSTIFRKNTDPWEPPQILQLVAIDASTGNLDELSFLEGQYVFNPSILLNEKPISKEYVISIDDTTVYESDLKAVVKVRLNKPLSSAFRIQYKTYQGTAISSGSQKDFIAKSGYVNIPAGSLERNIQIILRKDKLKEPDESFTVALHALQTTNDSIQLEDSIAVVTIQDGARPQQNSNEIKIRGKQLIVNYSTSPKTLVAFVYPNPSSKHFTLLAHSKTNGQIQMTVTDGTGRLVESRSIAGDQLIHFGENYQKGLYFVQLIQKNEKIVFKLIRS